VRNWAHLLEPSFRGTYRRLLRYLAPYRASVAVAVLASLATAGAAAFYAYLLGPLLKSVLSQAGARIGPVFIQREDLAWKVPLLLAAVATAKAGAQYLQTGLMQATGQRVVSDLRSAVYGRLLELPPAYFDARHSGELLSRFTADVAQVEFAVSQALSSYFRDTIQILALLGVCLYTDARLFLVTFILLPLAVWSVSRFARSLKGIATRTQAGLGQLTELASDQLHNLPIVQAYGGGPRALKQFERLQRKYLESVQRSLLIRGSFTPTLELAGVAGVALAVGVGAHAVTTDPALAGKLLSFLAAALLMYQPLKSLSGTFSLVLQGVGAAQRLFEITEQKGRADAGREVGALTREIRVEGVRLSYGAGREALRGLSLRIPARSRVALVGKSGAGKTSLFSILVGFVSPDQGSVSWDGVDLEQVRISSLRSQIAWVQQEPVLFSGTIRFNLLIGRADATEEELWEALRQAHAAEFVRGFAAGLEEQVGERGSRLSGGERQRLAIARAFLRQPSVLLLDEPTSALDASAEREVHQGLAELMVGRTTVVIAHRLSTVRDADLIYVLQNGAVIEEGNHSQLVASGGHYANLLMQGEVLSEPRKPEPVAL